MEDIKEKEAHYLVPANVAAHFEFFQGFGWSELLIVAVAVAIGSIFFFLTGLITKTKYVENNNPMIYTIKESNTKNIEKIEVKKPVVSIPIRLLFIIVPGAVAFFAVKRDPNGQNIFTLIKGLKEFKTKQKRYLYIYESGLEE